MSDFLKKAIDSVIAREGGYSDNPNDSGGKTRYGITEAVARENGYTGDMRALPRELAVSIYEQQYYYKPGFDVVARQFPKLAERLLDCGVNMGPATAVKFLQRALAALSRDGTDYPKPVIDGVCGPGTIAALVAYRRIRYGDTGDLVLMRTLSGLQTARYVEIVETRPRNATFMFGWIAHRIWP